MTSLRKTYLDYPHIAAVFDYVDYAREQGTLLIVLFGSVARGQFHDDSDADVLVLVDKPLAWRQAYQRTRGIIQPVVKTVDEFVAQVQAGEPFFIEMIEDGIPLYDADHWQRRMVNEVRAAKQQWGMQRTDYGWQWAR